MKILIVEDDRSLSKALRIALEQAGYQVAVASNGAEGLAAVKADKPDLLLLDIVMPEVSGLEMLRRVREDKSISDLYTVLLTNKSDGEDVAAALDMGVVDYLVKSDNTLQEILQLIDSRINAENS